MVKSWFGKHCDLPLMTTLLRLQELCRQGYINEHMVKVEKQPWKI